MNINNAFCFVLLYPYKIGNYFYVRAFNLLLVIKDSINGLFSSPCVFVIRECSYMTSGIYKNTLNSITEALRNLVRT